MRSRRRSPNPSAQLITQAATPILAKLGCRQRGHSRLWIADQGFWLVLIEFLPSTFGQETTLNAGACWLWYAQGTVSFDYGYRIADFAPYRDDAQFAPVAQEFASRAAAEVAAIHAKFGTVGDVARHLVAAGGDGWWPLYHAGVACALAGDGEAAGRFFQRLAEKPASRAWERTLQADASALARHLPDLGAFRAAATDVIARARLLQGLPQVPPLSE